MAPLSSFMEEESESIIGKLTQEHSQDLLVQQTNAWQKQIAIIKEALLNYACKENYVCFEFSIPRMGKRADVVLVIAGVIFVIEFKVGADYFSAADKNQANDYALDLKNFHEGSHDKFIIPVLLATQANTGDQSVYFNSDGVSSLLLTNGNALSSLIQNSLDAVEIIEICNKQWTRVTNCLHWLESAYNPTPTIIQAATALYQGHNIKEISRNEADKPNLTVTSSAIQKVIANAKKNNQKAICFITGVPGAGKTLVGLNITTSQMLEDDVPSAVFLSGNGPLVDVIREALARDESSREAVTKSEARRNAEAFIQNIHHFRDEYIINPHAPSDKVIVFDEAQRAWDLNSTSNFMKAKRRQENFDLSEPEFLIQVMDRHKDWCVVIALIGGGQEINTGEAGLPEWFAALKKYYSHWHVYHSPDINHRDYTHGIPLEKHLEGLKSRSDSSMHLAISMRSFRAERVSEFVGHLISNRPVDAKNAYLDIKNNYPIVMTRSLDVARKWLKEKAQGTELYGLIASSGAIRLKPEGLNIKAKISPAEWFLNGFEDVRSCQYLEDVATEFDIQGLELDWAGVCWDADFRYYSPTSNEGSWTFNKFSGTKWQHVSKAERQQYLANSYRVLLTRARQGLIIYIPRGSKEDATRPESFYNDTAAFIRSSGVEELN